MPEETDTQKPDGEAVDPASDGSGPCGFGWVTRDNPRWEDWGAWSARILVMTHSDGPMVVYVPEYGLPEYEHQDELADPDEWAAWSEIPRVQNAKLSGSEGEKDSI